VNGDDAPVAFRGDGDVYCMQGSEPELAGVAGRFWASAVPGDIEGKEVQGDHRGVLGLGASPLVK
jgi:hypothetical protein